LQFALPAQRLPGAKVDGGADADIVDARRPEPLLELGQVVNRNPWYREVAKEELARLTGPERTGFETSCGADLVAHNIGTWTAMIVVLESGEHCPHHLRGRKRN
jgi:hypothetical protein